jgi:hypothetical protein
LAQFQTALPVHIAFCSLGAMSAFVLLFVYPDMWHFSATCFGHFFFLLTARLGARRYASQDRALLFFGRGWVSATAISCVCFYLTVSQFELKPANNHAAWLFIFINMTIPVYLHFSGLCDVHRLMISGIIGLVYTVSPKWAAMPHNEATVLVWLSLLAGEVAGAHLSTLLFRWSVAFREASREVGSSVPATSATKPDPPTAGGTAPPKMPAGECPLEGRSEGRSSGAAASESAWAAGEQDSPEDMCADELLRWFFRTAEIDCRKVRILPLTLAFDDRQMELLYTISTFSRLFSTHCYMCFAAVCICTLAIRCCPTMRPIGAIIIPYASVLWLARLRVRAYTSVPRSVSELGAWQTTGALLAGACFCFGAVRNASWGACADCTVESADCPAPGALGLGQSEGHRAEPGLDASMDSVGIVCASLLLMLSGAYHRVCVVPPNATVTSRAFIIICVAVGHTDLQDGLLLPGALEKTMLAFMVMMMGATSTPRQPFVVPLGPQQEPPDWPMTDPLPHVLHLPPPHPFVVHSGAQQEPPDSPTTETSFPSVPHLTR